MNKNEDGLTILRWDDRLEKGYVYLVIELENNIVTKIRIEKL